MPKKILDALPGLVEVYHPASDGKWAIETIQDVEPILERNKAMQNDGSGGWSPTRDFRRAASIPDVVILQWKKQYGVDIHNPDHWPAVKKLLNSSEWQWLRTAPGRL